jgi:cytochrome P450
LIPWKAPTAAETTGEKYLLSCVIQLNEEPEPAATFQRGLYFMVNLFSDEVRRNPYPLYDQMRTLSPLLHVPAPFDGWLIFDYQGVKRALNDQELFSSHVPAPRNWFIFFDPPEHTKLRGLISRAFTPKSIAAIESHICELSRQLLEQALRKTEFDLAMELSIPLPMKVIARMIGIPATDWARFKRWSDSILKLSYARGGGEEAQLAGREFNEVTGEMNEYLTVMIAQRRAKPEDDLLTRLIEAEMDGERLSQEEILGFFQLLVVGGQETTTNLINNAILCFLENPDQLALVRSSPELLTSAIEEVLRYRSPLQWVMRTPRRDVEINGQVIPAGKLVLPMIGSANRDAQHFTEPNRFDIRRSPNPHIAFGHGIHSCLGAALARMEARIALGDFLRLAPEFELASNEPWQPRRALHVHGPTNLALRVAWAKRGTSALTACPTGK